jgi:hypothetical protein
MTAGLHATLLGLVLHALRLLPGSLRGALDAWSHRVARRRALERQRKWQQVRTGGSGGSAAVVAYHLKPWRD